MDKRDAMPTALLSAIDPDGPLEGVLLFKRTGVALASWTRSAVPMDVVTVMAATLVGSLDTIVGALGEGSPETIFLEAESRRILIAKVEPQAALALVGPASLPEAFLRQEANRLLRQIVPPKALTRLSGSNSGVSLTTRR